MVSEFATPAARFPRLEGLITAHRLRSIALILLGFVLTTLAVSVADARERAAGTNAVNPGGNVSTLWWVLGVAIVVSLWWRRERAQEILLASSLAALLGPLDPFPALVALAHLVAARRPRVLLVLNGAFVTLAVWWCTHRDMQGRTESTSFWQMILDGADLSARLGFVHVAPTLVTAIAMAAFIGIGYYVRAREDVRHSQAAREVDRKAVVQLTDEMARQAERERIAREVHDVIGHRLSLISLHAGTIELSAREAQPELGNQARTLQGVASQAMDDLRSLLGVVRDPRGQGSPDSSPTLSDVPTLVNEALAARLPLVASLVIDGVSSLDDAVSRDGFRIVQEVLTNASRHGLGVPVRLDVRADPSVGVLIECGNSVASGVSAGAIPFGHGLTGIAERARQHGGDATWAIDAAGVFRVAARMPWLPRRGAI